MRLRKVEDGLTVKAVSGTYVVHLGFDVDETRRRGLLGFAVYRRDETENEEYWLLNKRTFREFEGTQNQWPTNEAPLQKFRWGDYSAKPRYQYEYSVYAAYGRPGDIRLEGPVRIAISTEDPSQIRDAGGVSHQVHFSRGAGASQAYANRFGDRTPDEVAGDAAFKWLSRGLLEGMLAFIDSAQRGDQLCIAIYEFQLPVILTHVAAAVARGVEVKILYDAGASKTGPAEGNRMAIQTAGLQASAKGRTGLRNYISHHKFIVLVRNNVPRAVWTGSTNMSRNGIYAQLNVAHVLEDQAIARAYFNLHRELWNDPPVKATRTYLDRTYPDVTPDGEAVNSCIFSPRSKQEAMEYYLQVMTSAKQMVVLTTPFGVDPRIETYLKDSSREIVKFGLMGSADRYGGQVTRLDSIDGTFYTMPARLRQSVLDTWQAEQFPYKSHAYIHTKFLLVDPMTEAPLLVTGSANFSKASCSNNDENMLIIRGHKAAADVYMTEFLRMFEHYEFRHLVEDAQNRKDRLPLAEDERWTQRYFTAGSEREQDRLLFSGSFQ